MRDETNERWVIVVPATPLVILVLSSILVRLIADITRSWLMDVLLGVAALMLRITFQLSPFIGAGVLVYLFWRWLKETLVLKRSYVLAGILLSALDILIPLGVLAYLLYFLRDAKLSF